MRNQDYKTEYNAFGVIVPSPMVDEVLENKNGIDNPVIDLDTDNPIVIIDAQGLVNGSNVDFIITPKPTVIVSDGKTLREGFGWSYASSTATLTAAPSTDIFGLL